MWVNFTFMPTIVVSDYEVDLATLSPATTIFLPEYPWFPPPCCAISGALPAGSTLCGYETISFSQTLFRLEKKSPHCIQVRGRPQGGSTCRSTSLAVIDNPKKKIIYRV